MRCLWGRLLQAPHFETDGRLRGSHFLPREEAEAAQMAARAPFRARPLE
jgi:hypothetical protein